ncbi:MAG: PspA/IM30 family protein [Bryobacteraceae bacterium]
MALLERVGTLLRANLNDLVDRAEEPEKMIKQVILDMENQLMQVKTQVAIAIADQHVLERKRDENTEKGRDWGRKAELAVDKNQDDLARAAIERALSHQKMGQGFDEQIEDQKVQVENLKSALHKLEQKLTEARAKSDLLIARHRRSRSLGKATEAQAKIGKLSNGSGFDRLKDKVDRADALSQANAGMLEDEMESRLAALDKEDQIDRLLAELKSRKGITAKE